MGRWVRRIAGAVLATIVSAVAIAMLVISVAALIRMLPVLL